MMDAMTSLTTTPLPTDRLGRTVEPEPARRLLEPLDAAGKLAWGYETFGEGFALTTSFGIQSAVLLHMASRLSERIPVLWVDTGYLPPETYLYADRLCTALNLNLKVVQADLSAARMEALYGRLWESGRVEDLQTYHRLRKVEPLDRLFQQLGVHCWASGVRGGQTDHRGAMAPLDGVRGRWSLRPLLSWDPRQVFYYMENHALPQHPLFEQGYSSVGDWHSSRPDDGDGRASRFGGLKQECGIHLPGVMGEGI
ncbi:phosphoadenylyl-sulfate reductase [Synechococcus sp. CS-1329]|nr:phosphoadenylyl-sulfate reductase [Synechococcus sp. CS-1329]